MSILGIPNYPRLYYVLAFTMYLLKISFSWLYLVPFVHYSFIFAFVEPFLLWDAIIEVFTLKTHQFLQRTFFVQKALRIPNQLLTLEFTADTSLSLVFLQPNAYAGTEDEVICQRYPDGVIVMSGCPEPKPTRVSFICLALNFSLLERFTNWYFHVVQYFYMV